MIGEPLLLKANRLSVLRYQTLSTYFGLQHLAEARSHAELEAEQAQMSALRL